MPFTNSDDSVDISYKTQKKSKHSKTVFGFDYQF